MWTIDARFAEIIAKMLDVGNDLKTIPHQSAKITHIA